MNDRYLFRGKRKDTGAWMIGSLVCFPDDNKHCGIWSENAQSYLWVNPATVGQCTGSKDKNGTLIFEGDILKSPIREWSFTVIWDDGRWLGITSLEKPSLTNPNMQRFLMPICSSGEPHYPTRSENTEIIGNIHDKTESEAST